MAGDIGICVSVIIDWLSTVVFPLMVAIPFSNSGVMVVELPRAIVSFVVVINTLEVVVVHLYK